ncbi:MAG: hypothetical protein KDA87_11465 [Planctomycetales bacterium]|nr:hypothetical protein [Planctomycetales bacterium]
MLDLNSKRWAEFASTVNLKMASFLRFLDTNPTENLIRERFDDFISIYDDLTHQQTTWIDATASMPHLLMIASRLPLEIRCEFWRYCGYLHRDGAWQSPDHELNAAYSDSVKSAKMEMLSCANECPLTPDSEFSVAFALSAMSDNDFATEFVDYDTIFEFECAHCHTQFEGEQADMKIVFGKKLSSVATPKEMPYFIVPPADVTNFELRVGQENLAWLCQLIESTRLPYVKRWLSGRLGDFQCPNCGNQSWAVPI